MGLLGDLYSTIDSKKRQLRGLLSDPLETLYQGVRNFGAEQQGLLDMQARAYPWTGTDRTAAPDLAARKALADAGAAQGMAAATVWHGSPHKFDKFDSSKIGTGEGAQAYGHGLYLAESDKVAGEYANMFAKSPASPAQLLKLRDAAPKGGAEWSHYDDLVKNGQGSLYKVDLPDDAIAKMLDWDKPLSQQPKAVQTAYKKYLKSPQASEHAKSWTRYSDGMRLDQAEPLLKNPSGENLYKNAFQSREAANQWALENGIPGIRYLDGGSRGAGQGSSNFVVFPGNEGLLSILERNGAPIK